MANQYGVDISAHQSDQNWTLFKQTKGYVVVECYQPTGHVNTSMVENVRQCQAAGLVVQLYHYPDPKGDASAQVQAWHETLTRAGLAVKPGTMVWIDVEGRYEAGGFGWGYWPENPQGNLQFIEDLKQALVGLGYSPGVYSQKGFWNLLTDHSVKFGDLPLWWTQSLAAGQKLSDFYRFGGWQKMAMRQYGQNEGAKADGQYDLDWYPIG